MVATPEQATVRVLGRLRVDRADGTAVPDGAWPTSATAELVRLLALSPRGTARVDHLVGALWPDVDRPHALASLRTTASRARRVLGGDCVGRHLDAVALVGVWTDAQAYRDAVRDVRRFCVAGELAQAVTAARRAEAVYGGAPEPRTDVDWVVQECAWFVQTHGSLLVDVADAAAFLHWWRDASWFAERALGVEPCSERAYRALMRARHGLGENGAALQVYERCCRVLAEQVGVVPSPATRELHRALLAGEDVEPAPARRHVDAR
nr:BTAD domain-containing putative transcriptional regulator [uncultured Actinotalea sp.]